MLRMYIHVKDVTSAITSMINVVYMDRLAELHIHNVKDVTTYINDTEYGLTQLHTYITSRT